MFPLAFIVEVAIIENLCFGNSQQLEELGGISVLLMRKVKLREVNN